MSIDLLKQKAITSKAENSKPTWVSNRNKTAEIHDAIELIARKKGEYIARSKHKKDFNKKSNFQISVSELAREVRMANTTISHTSAYSKGLMLTLNDFNEDLLKQAKGRKDLLQKRLQRGLKASKKDDILVKLKKTETELKRLKKLNASEQVTELVNGLSLPVKQKLGL